MSTTRRNVRLWGIVAAMLLAVVGCVQSQVPNQPFASDTSAIESEAAAGPVTSDTHVISNAVVVDELGSQLPEPLLTPGYAASPQTQIPRRLFVVSRQIDLNFKRLPRVAPKLLKQRVEAVKRASCLPDEQKTKLFSGVALEQLTNELTVVLALDEYARQSGWVEHGSDDGCHWKVERDKLAAADADARSPVWPIKVTATEITGSDSSQRFHLSNPSDFRCADWSNDCESRKQLKVFPTRGHRFEIYSIEPSLWASIRIDWRARGEMVTPLDVPELSGGSTDTLLVPSVDDGHVYILKLVGWSPLANCVRLVGFSVINRN